MNLGALFTAFGLVIPAELPDKTFISCLVMASRHRALPVWIGGAAALVLQAGIAVIAGRLLVLLPRTAVESIVAALFLAGAAYLIFVPEKREAAAGDRIASAAPVTEEEAAAERAGLSRPFLRPMFTTFGVVALAEFGDLTQILVANLTARFRDPWAVFVGASAGFILVSGVGVLFGRAIIRVVPLALVRRLSGAALLGLGIYSLVQVA